MRRRVSATGNPAVVELLCFRTRQFGSVFVATGPIVGQNRNGKIGIHQVAVPDAFFKALLVYKDDSFHGIAFEMLNNPAKQRLLESYLSVNELEKIKKPFQPIQK